MVISWLYNGFMMDIWWFCMLARWVKEANKRREMERSLLILDAQRAGLQTSVIKIIINKQVDDYCYHLHNHLHELMSLKRINHQCPPESWTTHPARTAWALAAEAVWAALRRERRRRPRSWRRSARAMNIWTGGAKLELVTIDSWVLSLSVYSYCLQSGRGKYLGQLTLLALAFFQIKWD